MKTLKAFIRWNLWRTVEFIGVLNNHGQFFRGVVGPALVVDKYLRHRINKS